MNRRKFFSFIATAPVATVVGAKAALDANGNDAAPLVGDFWRPSELNELVRQHLMERHAHLLTQHQET